MKTRSGKWRGLLVGKVAPGQVKKRSYASVYSKIKGVCNEKVILGETNDKEDKTNTGVLIIP
jgi:hypothetical protein